MRDLAVWPAPDVPLAPGLYGSPALTATLPGGRTKRASSLLDVGVIWGSTVAWDNASPKGAGCKVLTSGVASAVLDGRRFHATVERGT